MIAGQLALGLGSLFGTATFTNLLSGVVTFFAGITAAGALLLTALYGLTTLIITLRHFN